MIKTNLTQIRSIWGNSIVFGLLLLTTFLPKNLSSQTTCAPQAEFSYNASVFCQNGPNPVLTHTTGTSGVYSYTVTSGGPTLSLNPATGAINLSASNPGVYQVKNTVSVPGGSGTMVITGVVDGPLTGGIPKAVEFYVLQNIPNLSIYGFGSANNGNGTNGQEFTFPAVAANAGTRIWVATEATAFTAYFGFPPTYTNGTAPNINGDDAIELFCNGVVIDIFGTISYPAGTGPAQPWYYMDGWAYRVSNTGPDGSTFVLANWTFSGPDALDGTTTNSGAMNPWPIGSYTVGATFTCTRTIEIVAPPAAEAGPNQMVCESTNVVLAATGVGTWSGGAGTFSNVNNPNATYTPAASETGTIVTLTWTVLANPPGVCTSASDQMHITILELPDAEFSYDKPLYCPNGTNPVLSHTTGTDGLYTYTVISGGPTLDLNNQTGAINLAGSNRGTYEVTNQVSGCGNLVISGIIDGDVTGGLPKAVEFFALNDIPDLSAYGFGAANNGGGTDGQEYTFPPVSIAKGGRIWVATETTVFTNFFGFPPTFTDPLAPSVNGDDAIELFCNGQVIDVFGQITYSTSPTTLLPWNYRDGWAYRVSNTGPNGSFFELTNWTYMPLGLDNATTNATAPSPAPIATFTSASNGVCPNAEFSVVITIDDAVAPVITCPGDIVITLAPGFCSTAVQFNVTATDNCAPSPTITQIDNTGFGPGGFFPIGTHTLTFQATDLVGNTASCSFTVTINEFPNPTPVLTCNDLVYVSLTQNGTAIVGADMVLEGGPYGCYDDYVVNVFDGNGLSLGNTVNCSFIGSTYTVKVTDPETGNVCWGQLKVEDKLAPVINCTDRTISCTATINTVPPPSVADNCDPNPVLNKVEEILIDDDACDNNQVQYRRVWISSDKYGNVSATCQEIITVTRPAVVNFPNDITWQCGQYAARPNIINANKLHPSIIDTKPSPPDTDNDIDVSPTLSNSILSNTGSGIPTNLDGIFCQYGYVHFDEVLEVCGGAPGVLKIIRTWTVLDWCSGQVITFGFDDVNNNGVQDPGEEDEDNIQIIKVIDETAPVISASNITVNANVPGVHPALCRSTGFIPAPTVTDNCTGVATVKILTPIGEAVNGQIPSPGLPLGNHIVNITATDACGNFSSIQITLTVVDNTAPVAVCDKITDVNLSSDGIATVFAETFDDGSHDNCCLDHFEVRRMTDSCNDGHDDTVFGPSVVFCCADVPNNPITVVFRVFDCHGNFNDCMVQVYVQDKQNPVLVSCPQTQRITCDFFAENIQTQLDGLATPAAKSQFLDQFFGAPTFADNCDLTINRTIGVSVDQCLEGSISRSWTAQDAAGNISQTCSQTVFVDHVSDWVVEFPADITATCGNTVPEFGEPEIFFETCELVAVSYTDELFTTVPDACYKILRTWTVINWCVVGANIDQEVTEQPENQLGLPFPQCDLNGDNDCNGRTFRDSWRSGPAANHPTAAQATQATNPDTDTDSDPWDGFITYQQTIKVIDNVAPVFSSGCTIPDVCISDNTCVASFTLPTPSVDDCSTNVTITATGDLGSGFGPFTDVAPGTYNVTYTAIDNCNNQKLCTTSVKVKDCKKPTPYCKTGLIVTLMNTQPPMIEVWASDMDEGSFDNCPGDLKFSFSENVDFKSIVFDCDDIASTLVNIWVTDAAGNQDFCQTLITVQDQMGVCDDPLVTTISGLISTETNAGIENVEVQLSGSSSIMAMTNTAGMYEFAAVPVGGDYTVVPVKDTNPLNGVSTFDLVLITKHILGTQLLNSPYKIIAADVNKSNSVTTFDMVELRKLVLFIYTELPNNTSWRFVRKNFVFPNPANPFQTTFPELININNLGTNQLNANFVGIKTGDVNGSAATQGLLGSEDRTTLDTFLFESDDVMMLKGETYTVNFKSKHQEVAGFQFTLDFDREEIEFIDLIPGVMTQENFGFTLIQQNAITASWNQVPNVVPAGDMSFGLVIKAKADGRLSDALRINSRFTPAEAYDLNHELMTVALHFNNGKASNQFELFQNVPNPFGNFTEIGFNLPKAAPATITITDVAGRTVKVISGDFANGYNSIRINRAECLANGVLYYRLETEDFTATRKMILID